MRDIEIRNFDIASFNDSRLIEGYGSVFNSRSVDLGGFVEVIEPGAFEGVVEKSDVKCYLEHDQKRGILARSRNGEGSLKLELDDKGLKYSFEAPETNLGNEVLVGLRRKDYTQSSFAFSVEKDTWTKEDDGTYLRTINKISKLYDVSIVANPAYEETSVAVAKRSLQEFIEQNETEDNQDSESDSEVIDSQATESETEEPVVEETTETEETTEEPVVEENRNYTKSKNIHMKNFSLIKTINDVVNNRNINDNSLSVLEMGVAEMRKSGLSYAGQIQLPVEERADGDAPATAPAAIMATVETQGEEIVATEKLHILDPLYNNSVLSELGVTFMSGLVGNISIPKYSGSTVGWKGEMIAADNGNGEFDSVELSPKRLTAYIDISKQFLVQDSVGAEEMLRRDIVKAISQKLESTIFGSEAGDANKPAGIFAGATAVTPSYDVVVDMEQALETGNFTADKKFVLSPAAKAAFKKTTVSGEKSDLRMLYNNGEIEGYDAVTSNAVAGYAIGDWGELIVAQWGALDLTIDPYTQAANGAIRIVVNAYFDAVVRREGAIVANVLA